MIPDRMVRSTRMGPLRGERLEMRSKNQKAEGEPGEFPRRAREDVTLLQAEIQRPHPPHARYRNRARQPAPQKKTRRAQSACLISSCTFPLLCRCASKLPSTRRRRFSLSD